MKVKFLLRVKNFIADKDFESRGGVELTDEVKALVAASAVQITFGLHKYTLSHFSKIILYPESFYNRLGDEYHIGETNVQGVIVLSWKDLQDGFLKATDNFNVGLHEMAHALELQWRLEDDYDSFFGNYFEKWSMVADEEFENIENERESFLRKYAGANKHEFFAVCMEYFFESSKEFRERLPQIYYQLCILLNQDPLQADTHVEEIKRKPQEQLKSELTAITPVFKTEFSFRSISFHAVYLLLIFTVIAKQGFKSSLSMLYIPMIIATVAVLITIYRNNKIIFYENYLAVRNIFGNIKIVYEMDEIIAVTFGSDRAGNSMEVIRARGGKIIRNSYSHNTSAGNISKLKEIMREKKIVVR